MRRVVAIGIGVAAMAVLGACGRDDPADPTATGVPATQTPSPAATERTATATPSASVEEEVLRAYARYWDAYARAMADLDETLLPDVMTGARLERARAEIQSLRDDGNAARIVVESTPQVVTVAADEALLVDVYLNSSYLVDAATKEPVAGTGSPTQLRDLVALEFVDGVWKVREVTRQVGTQ